MAECLDGTKPIGCKWVFRAKLKADRLLDKYKAILVAKGFNQVEGIDYKKTFSLVIKPQTIHLVLELALSKNCPIK